MSTTTDPRLVRDNTVTTKPRNVISDIQCRRIYGNQWKVSTMTGKVLSHEIRQSNGRGRKLITVDYTLPSRMKQVTLHVSQIQLHFTEEITPSTNTEPHPPNSSAQVETTISSPPVTKVTEQPATPVTMNPTQNQSPEIFQSPEEKIVSHGYEWTTEQVVTSLNGPMQIIKWKTKNSIGETLIEG